MDRTLYMITSEVIPLATGAVVLYYAIVAMNRIKWPAFRYWVWAAGLGIVGHIILDLSRSGSAPFSTSARHGFWVFWCFGYAISALLGTYGTVCLVRHLLADRPQEHIDV